jgi:transitional endoplasmic reticulum ATPase
MSQQATTVKNVEVVRQGTQIVIPPKMTYDEAIEWCKRKRDEDEREVNVHHEIYFSPLDGAVAFHKALAAIYGWTELVPTPGFFGSTPPTMIGVPVGVNEKIQVPWGRVCVPGIHGFLQTGIVPEPTPRFIISGRTKQKHMEEVKAIVEKTEEILRTQSIYKGQAIKVSFEWQREGQSFDPSEHCPKFMRLEGVKVDDLIFGKEVSNALNIGLFTPIEQAEACRRYHVPLKRGILLYGPYGTGKTLTANVTALRAVQNKFTFIYLDNVLDLKKGLQFASQYAPAILFAEDIDRALEGERTLSMDEVLNIMDGVDTKGSEILTVFTTNHVENINPALLRMGRLDTLVEVKPPDAEAAVRLVKLYARNLLHKEVDFTKVGNVLKGRIPAFIREVTERAKIAAIYRLSGGDIEGKVLEEDLLAAASAMEPHAAMLESRKRPLRRSAEVLVRLPENHDGVEDVLENFKLDRVLSRNGDDD